MAKIIWYVGSNEPDSSLNVLFNALDKHSKHTFIKGTSKTTDVLDSDADILIGSYRYYNDNFIERMRDRFGENCFCFIHGFRSRTNESADVFADRYKAMNNNGVRFMVSCLYSLNYLKSLDLDGYVLPFGVDLDTFVYKERTVREKKPIIGMCYQKRKEHRKGANVLSLLGKVGYKTNTAVSVSHHKLSDFYNSIDCLIVASKDDGRETFCLPIIEAAACGVPTISTPVGCAPDVIKDGVNGFIVDTRLEIVDKIVDIGTVDGFIEMGRNAKKIAEKKWSWNKGIVVWDKFFKEQTNG
jgi:hypothetical protein